MSPGLVETGLLATRDNEVEKSFNLKATSSNETTTREATHEHTGWTPYSDDDFAVLAVRNLVLDLCMQNGGGHGGSALGMAAIGVALWKHVMRFNPCDPEWFDRDRFVLSNGHASMFLYTMNHLVGYDAWSLDELKGYGDAKLNGYKTISHAHPEIEVPGVEVTTGPLGQGIANAVGLAIASKNLAANFNRPGFDVVKSRIYCMTGDGCLMEGVALEAIALAGHLELSNLVLLYDNNQVTCDGPLNWINTEDINGKMRASGWYVIDVEDGRYDVDAIVCALHLAKKLTRKPVFINIRTVIGVDMASAGTAKAHHGGFDAESIASSKKMAGLSPDSRYEVPKQTLDYLRQCREKGIAVQKEWEKIIGKYGESHLDLSKGFTARQKGTSGDYQKVLDGLDSNNFVGMPTRETNGIILETLWKEVNSLCGGGADLVNSNKIVYSEADVFSPKASFKGRYIRNGIREHAMASIANGMAAYAPGTFLPITATFFMFYIYAAPGVRMGALSHLQVIHIATHDSFAEGQNGPTHQPVELDSLYRAMPNLSHMRPCDAEELLGAWSYALRSTKTPSMISVARDAVGPVPNTSRKGFQRGAYILTNPANAAITLVSCGSNLHYAVAAATQLEMSGIAVRLISAPCLALFDEQDSEYKESVFPHDGKPIVSVEEYVATLWARYVTASIGMTSFGYSASNESNYERFGLDTKGIVGKVEMYLEFLKMCKGDARQAGWQQL